MSSIIMPRGIIKPPGLVLDLPMQGEITGPNLFDPNKGTFEVDTESWVALNANTIAVSTDKAHSGLQSLKVTYVDHAGGAYMFCSAAGDLISNLVVGNKYRAIGWLAVNSGASLRLEVWNNAGAMIGNSATVTSETMVPISADFIAENTALDTIRLGDMDAGEIAYLDDLTIHELYTPDVSGLGYHGTVDGPTVDPGGGFLFDGIDDFIDLGASVGDYTDKFTLLALINTTANADRILSRRGTTLTQWDWFINNSPPGPLGFFVGGPVHAGTILVDDGLDHWVGVVIDGANSKFYVDGLVDGTFNPGTITSRAVNTMIGAYGDTGNLSIWDGAIRKSFIFNRALNEAQIQYEMYRSAPLKPVMNGGVLWPN